MNLFLVTTINTKDIEDFKVNPDGDMISWIPVLLKDTQKEENIIADFAQKDLTVVGIESLELLQQKMNILKEFENNN